VAAYTDAAPVVARLPLRRRAEGRPPDVVSAAQGAPGPGGDRARVAELLGRTPLGSFRVVVRDFAGDPVVIRNHPLLDDGTPMPTHYWLVGAPWRRAVDRLESAGGVRQAEAGVDPGALADAHRRYAAARDADMPVAWSGPAPTGGVGGARRGVKCLHAHYAWYLAGGEDPVGAWTQAQLDRTGPGRRSSGLLRPARREDLPQLAALEEAAGAGFAALGMETVAADPPPSLAFLEACRAGGRAWVAELDGRVVGYALAEVVDGDVHLAQVSVHPDLRGRRLGAGLLDLVEEWGIAAGSENMTLTTFAEVPWNAPYYARLGFRPLSPAELGDGLAARRAAEVASGLDAWPRLAMVRPLDPSPAGRYARSEPRA